MDKNLQSTHYSQRAIDLFKQGYNCSQAVLAAFCDELGIDFETALRISAPFGGGMGKMREVCGAVSGMFMAAGMKYGYCDPEDSQAKAEHYSLIQSMAFRFKEENGSIICRDLLELETKTEGSVPEPRTKEYYKKRPCAELVGFAAQITEQLLRMK